MDVQLGQHSGVFLGSLEAGFVFNQFTGAVPSMVQFSGSIPPGHYNFGANTGLGAPNLFPGQNHITYSGSFSGLSFSVETPEPGCLALLLVVAIGKLCERRRTVACAMSR
jgi:hypothetical protein